MIFLLKKDKFITPLYQAIYDRIYKRKQNTLIVIVGGVGTGKSLLALRIGKELDPTFTEETLKERVVISPEQFLELVVNKKDKLKTGSVIIIDEAGTQLGSRDWYTVNNRVISYVLQTFRYQRLIVIFTLPNMSFLDVHARRMFDFYIETLKIDFSNNQTIAKVYGLSYDKMKPDKPYKKAFRVRDEKGRKTKVSRFRFPKVNAKMVNVYEKYAQTFKERVAEEALKQSLHIKEAQHQREIFNPHDVAKKVLDNKERYVKVWGNKEIIDHRRIEIDFNLGRARAARVKEIAENSMKTGENTTHTPYNSN